MFSDPIYMLGICVLGIAFAACLIMALCLPSVPEEQAKEDE